MTVRDAETLWLSARMPTDQYLLYCFDAAGVDAAGVDVAALARRCAGIADLRVRVAPVPGNLDYPYWVPMPVSGGHLVEAHVEDWAQVCLRVAELLTRPVDPTASPWRLHLFRGVVDAPGGPATVAVLQISHALADGTRAATIARALFGESAPTEESREWPIPMVARIGWGLLRLPVLTATTVWRGVRVARAGSAPRGGGGGGGMPRTAVNTDAGPRRRVAMIVCERDGLRIGGHTLTVGVLTAISVALNEYLASRGHASDRLGAEVQVAGEPGTLERNNFRNVGVDLRIDEPDLARRAAAIADALRARRVPGPPAPDAAVRRVLPAPVLRRDVARYPLDVVPPTVTGNTVVSSVNRGAADLALGGGRIRFTAGFPALSPAMALTHGVHGIGDTVTVSVVGSPDVMPDFDEYVQVLRRALRAP
ncbi:MAG TPA: WS/DGAT domain-containing protein [Aldersonia sp.]